LLRDRLPKGRSGQFKDTAMKKNAASPPIAELLHLLDEAYNRRSWHGTNLRGSIRGLTADQAGWRGGNKHSIADIVVHCAYWKYSVRRRLRGEKRGSFALKGSNWFELPEPLDASAWRRYVGLLETEHRALRAAIAELPPRELDDAPAGGKSSNRSIIHGVVLHDVYHAGQIQVIKGMLRRLPAGAGGC
jgi:uncharacterized damage-inducible protein DinB